MLNQNTKSRHPYLFQYYLTSILLILLLIFNIIIWQLLKNQLQIAAQISEKEKLNSAVSLMEDSIHEYEEMATFGNPVISSDSLNRTMFNNYFSAIVKSHQSETTALKAVLYIEKTETPAKLISEMEKDTSIPLENRAFVKIHPYESTPAYVVKYIVPFAPNEGLLGYNAVSDSEQLKIIERAIRTNSISATKNQLFIDGEYFIFYLPSQTKINNKETTGILAILVDPKILFQNWESIAGKIPISVYEGNYKLKDISNAKLYFESNGDPLAPFIKKADSEKVVKYVPMADQTLTVVFSIPVNPELPRIQKLMLNILLFGGAGIIFIIFIIINLLILTIDNSHRQKEKLQTQ